MEVAERLMMEVKSKRPDLYEKILSKIRPHKLSSVLRIFQHHLRKIDLRDLNNHRDAIPEFCWEFVKRLRFPTPGDPFGIQLTCRITKSDTQGTLDSKHLKSSSGGGGASTFNVGKEVLDELSLFTTQLHVFEFANRHRYATVFVIDLTAKALLALLPESGLLERGGPFNKAKDHRQRYKYLTLFRFVVVEEDRDGIVKILYRSSRDLFAILKHVPLANVWAFSDVRYVYQKCGIAAHFFNMVKVARAQLLNNDGSVYEKDVQTLIKYQCSSGEPLPLTRDGLAKHPDRSPIDVLSFEAPKKNYARLSTCPLRDQWHEVKTSFDKIFFGQQFNEGTGYSFALMPSRSLLKGREEKQDEKISFAGGLKNL